MRVMADDCAFENKAHPYTQSMRGASPWEQVPDLLHMHGMCSHRNWFAYRNALQVIKGMMMMLCIESGTKMS